MKRTALFVVFCLSHVLAAPAQGPTPVVHFAFDGSLAAGSEHALRAHGAASFTRGLVGDAVRLSTDDSPTFLTLDGNVPSSDRTEDFSAQFWVRTTAGADQRMVLLSRKQVPDNSLASQKHAGWAYYVSDGTWAWSIGSGGRRLTYERDNGEHMPLNDGRWHQLTMTYDSARAEVRLYYDGHNKVVYNVADADGFDFSNDNPLVVGWNGARPVPEGDLVAAIGNGAATLQEMVDEFNDFGLSPLEPEEFVNLIVDSERLYESKVEVVAESAGADRARFLESLASPDFTHISEIEAELRRNPYTIHQSLYFMGAAPTMKIYSLLDGVVTVNERAARAFSERERLYPSDFDMDDLSIWDRTLSAEEVLAAYAEHFEPATAELDEAVTSITAGAWNIYHGGKHFTADEHGWDSRVAIAETLEREGVDVVMMQETYSSGDFIAAQLGYYFATTVDGDGLNQGSNISVLSRYPIKEIYVPQDATFMNVAAKVAISETQDLYVMSNWYGMSRFPAVFDFHQARFAESDTIPTLFAGDFNAIPHTDGGESVASRTLLDAGFTDAFRGLYPDVETYPGYSHRSDRRIDQIYYKGAGLRNTSMKVMSTYPLGTPSDHYLMIATFGLQYDTPSTGR